MKKECVMNARKTASLVIKLIGVFVFVQNLGYLPMALETFYYSFWKNDYSDSEKMMGLVNSLGTPWLYLTMCILVIGFSNAIARRLVPDEKDSIAVNIDADTIQALAFCAIGLSVLAGAIPKLGGLVAYYFVQARMEDQVIVYRHYGQLAGFLIQVVIGAYLFLQPGGLVGLWKRLQTTPVPAKPGSSNNDLPTP